MKKAFYRVKTSVVAYVATITCNKCGNTVSVQETPESFPSEASQDMFPFRVGGGWGSTYPTDMMFVSFHLCGGCLKELTASFKHPPEEGSVLENSVETGTMTETGETVEFSSGIVLREGEDLNWNNPPLNNPPQSGLWKHFKGGHYEVITCVWDPLASEFQVVYRPLYGNDGGYLLRPLSMWLETVTRGTYSGPRFEFQCSLD